LNSRTCNHGSGHPPELERQHNSVAALGTSTTIFDGGTLTDRVNRLNFIPAPGHLPNKNDLYPPQVQVIELLIAYNHFNDSTYIKSSIIECGGAPSISGGVFWSRFSGGGGAWAF